MNKSITPMMFQRLVDEEFGMTIIENYQSNSEMIPGIKALLNTSDLINLT